MDVTTVLDREQLRDITMDDRDLMRDIVSALLEDTAAQISLLETAVRNSDTQSCVRLAHYSKGACANVGANRAAAVFKRIEFAAAHHELSQCSESLAELARELELLQLESVKL